MAAKRTTKEFYRTIQQEYQRLSAPDRKLGVKKYTDKYIYAFLAENYFRSPATIEAIIYNRINKE